jgi:uncharacterized protein YjiS (DUF1127 family)
MNFAAPHPVTASPAQPRRAAVRRSPVRFLAFAGGALREFSLYLAGSEHSRIRQRQRLAELDDRMLRDIGLARREPRRGDR